MDAANGESQAKPPAPPIACATNRGSCGERSGKKFVAGGRAFGGLPSDLSPCVSAAQWFGKHLRRSRPAGWRVDPPIQCCSSDTRWDGDDRYPHTTQCYGFEPKISPPTLYRGQTAVRVLRPYGEFSTTVHATLAGQQENLLGAARWSRDPLSNFTVADRRRRSGCGIGVRG